VYHLVSPAAPDEVLFLLYHSAVQAGPGAAAELLPEVSASAIQEITAGRVGHAFEGKPGTPRQHKAREEFIANRLDRKVKKPVESEEPLPAPAGPAPSSWTTPETAMARRGRQG
jgi:hypothetical protein